MKKKEKQWFGTILLLCLCLALLSSCAATRQSQQQTDEGFFPSAAKSLGKSYDAATKGEKGAFLGVLFGTTAKGLSRDQVGPYMDSQEADLRQILTDSKAVVNRQGEMIGVYFDGSVYFDTGMSEIKPEMRLVLDRVASVLANYPSTWVEIQGYADPKGSKAGNLRLSQDRANAVYHGLVKRGVNVARLKAIGFGEEKATSTGAPGRKVELKLMPIKEVIKIE